ncbi:MAG: glutathione-disulfide reductase [Alphaproteobacteria bacterium]|jgi:glutathione reductase (NADPH)|nr:glutathione-disulfide reductase [Alphaproteobacteria bacterium]PPR13648.1 MAG: Glutathione amide reductase [Alphaproteobacteria bacterium MarineAlpha12_Bin1]|tara:strand:+ start:14453 stop:15820 length:1368 start_codon:yes stop_codon:yes gene_type:complete
MSDNDYDLFVIGAGSAGVRAARFSANYGARVAIAEDLYMGGTCVNVGCIPKKLFVYAALYNEDYINSAFYGWKTKSREFNWRTLIDNKDQEIKRLNGIYESLLENSGADVFSGRATLVGPNTVVISGRKITANYILVATGGWPVVPNIPGKEYSITSNEAFYLESLPNRIIIVGGGYIAVEFAGIFNALGVETTLIYRGEMFMRGFDNDVRSHLAEEMLKKGVDIKFSTNISSIEKTNDELVGVCEDGSLIYADEIMYAIGRNPKVSGLGLEDLGVKTGENGEIIVDDYYKTTVDSIYAIGDVIDRIQLTPVALAEGMAVAKTLFRNQPSSADYEYIPTAVFSQPELGTVGLTEEEARKLYDEVAIYKSSFRTLKHTLTDSDEKTLMKMVVDKKSDRVLGVHMVGAHAGEILQGVAVALRAGATKSVFDTTIGIHPTSAEELVTMREPVPESIEK